MNNHELDLQLTALAAQADWPATPDIAGGIGARLPSRAAPSRRDSALPFFQRPLAAAVVLAVVVMAVIAGTVEPVRAEIEKLLGISGSERVERVPKVKPAPPLKLGRAVTLAEARRQASFRIRVPSKGFVPSEVRLGGDLDGGAVSLLFDSDTVLTEFPDSSVYPSVKQVGENVRVRFFDINGQQGIWVSAGPRALFLQSRDGQVHSRAAALPGSGLLLWQQGKVALRLETRRGLATALRLARSVR